MSYQNELKAELSKPQYAGLLDSPRRAVELAAAMNVRPVTETKNPEPQGEIFDPPANFAKILAAIPADEVPGLLVAEFGATVGLAYASAPEAAQMLLSYAGDESLVLNVPIGTAANSVLRDRDPELIAAMLTVLVASGLMTEKTMGALMALTTKPDPTWQPMVYEYGQSIASANSWPEVTAEAVTAAIA